MRVRSLGRQFRDAIMCLVSLGVYLPVINDVRVVRLITEGDYVAMVWQAETSFGQISLVYIFRIEAAKIVEIQAFYDPRGFLERMGMWTGA